MVHPARVILVSAILLQECHHDFKIFGCTVRRFLRFVDLSTNYFVAGLAFIVYWGIVLFGYDT